VSRLGVCTNGVENLVGFEYKSLQGSRLSGFQQSGSAKRPLLSDVYLLFFIYVAEEINQTTNKCNYGQPERYPTKTLTATRFGMGYKLVEVKDRTDGCGYADNHRQNVFQAFHVEPPARN